MKHPYEGLGPEVILDAVAAVGQSPDGHLLKLNSYENRVFQIGIDDAPPIIGKFYRPGRWSDSPLSARRGSRGPSRSDGAHRR